MGWHQECIVEGMGSIGAPLISVLARYGREIGVEQVFFTKGSPKAEDIPNIKALIAQGAQFLVPDEQWSAYEKLGLQPQGIRSDFINDVGVIINCTPKKSGLAAKREYEANCGSVLGFIAQGSESGFGKMYIHGVNDEALKRGKDRFLQVHSCNTHAIALLTKAIAGAAGGLNNLHSGRFVCIRRSSDIGQAGSVIAPKVDPHNDERFGTHHARDAVSVFETIGFSPNLQSSSAKANTPFMHTIHFRLCLERPVGRQAVEEALWANPLISVTQKQSANSVFSFGRDFGPAGRLLCYTVVSLPTLALTSGNGEVTGFAFTPQDGNVIVSNIAAALWFMYPDDWLGRLQAIIKLIDKEV